MLVRTTTLLRSPHVAHRELEHAFASARKRALLKDASIADLVSDLPVKSRSTIADQWKREVLSSDRFLVPHLFVDHGLKICPFPDGYTKELNTALQKQFGYLFEPGTFALVDRSFSRSCNERLTPLGKKLLTLHSALWVESVPEFASLTQEEMQELVDFSVHDSVLSEVFLTWGPVQSFLLTSVECALAMDSSSYYREVMGKSLLKLYVDAGVEEQVQAAGDSAKAREKWFRRSQQISFNDLAREAVPGVRSRAVQAMVASVYLEHGLDEAFKFVSLHVAPTIPKAIAKYSNTTEVLTSSDDLPRTDTPSLRSDQ